jgi:hypothetical protein
MLPLVVISPERGLGSLKKEEEREEEEKEK